MKEGGPLDHLHIASPCPAGWEQMTGDDRVRFCQLCNLNVYNISRMSRKEAEALIANAERRICARLYRRADGTVITGFSSLKLEDVSIGANELVSLDITLLIDHATALVGIIGETPLIDIPPGTTIISGDLIRKLPIRREE
jgi:hypothetical protein